MAKIVFVVPYPEMGAIVEKTFHEEQPSDWELHIELVVGVRDIGGTRDFSADVVVARGVTAVALRRMLPDTPIVDLPVSGYDILRAVKECKRQFAAERIGIVGSRDMIYGAEGIGDILDDVKLLVVEVRDEEDAEPSIRELRAQGVDVVIGGVMSTDIAKHMGMQALFIQTGREAIYQALREAKRVAIIRRQEQERGEQFRAILEYSAQGIVAVDAAGAISLANKAALELANLSGDVLGLCSGSIRTVAVARIGSAPGALRWTSGSERDRNVERPATCSEPGADHDPGKYGGSGCYFPAGHCHSGTGRQDSTAVAQSWLGGSFYVS